MITRTFTAYTLQEFINEPYYWSLSEEACEEMFELFESDSNIVEMEVTININGVSK